MIRGKWILAVVLSLSPLVAADNFNYIALGDSIAFGYDPLINPWGGPQQYIGYPEKVASGSKKLKSLENFACPGETSASFSSSTAPDNQCRAFKGAFGLKAFYTGTQMEAAVTALRDNPRAELVTISIGGNDLILLQMGCNNDAACIFAGLPQVLTNYGANLTALLTGLRQAGGYSGQIVLLTYYSPNYRDPVQTTGIAALNVVAFQVATSLGVKVADGFGAFLLASASAGGNTCTAGLLAKFPDGSCDVHPSPKGRDILAAVVLKAAK